MDAGAGVKLVASHFSDIPFWPQLPRRSFLENMYVQYSQNLPGVCLAGERMFVDTSQAPYQLEAFYQEYLSEDTEPFAIPEEYAEGLYAFLEHAPNLRQIKAVKGHITGPFSFSLKVTDQNKKSIIYDDTLRDAATKTLARKARWQEKLLSSICPTTIIFLDEPYLSAFGSAYVSLEREQVKAMLAEVLGELKGLTAVHCCGNTDWSLLLELPIDILSLDAYDYAHTLSLYIELLRAFLERGGKIAWGIVPTDKEKIAKESVSSLADRLEAVLADFERQGIPKKTLEQASLITPACGVGSLPEDVASLVFATTAELSAKLRQKL